MVGKPIPPEELPEIDVADLESLHILEDIEWDRRVERKLLVPANQPSLPVWCKFEAGNLGEGGVEIFELGLDGGFLPLSPSGGYAGA